MTELGDESSTALPGGQTGQVRFTAWLSPVEKRAMRSLAGELGSSGNYIVRTALRVLLGLPVSPWAYDRLERELARRRQAISA